MPNVFVTLINFNGENDTKTCLKSLNEVNVEGFSFNVVVLDNASDKKIVLRQSDYRNFKLHFIGSKANLGFSGGHNLGIEFAIEKGADFVVVLNNDVIVDKNFISALLNTFSKFPSCGIVSPKIYFAKGHEFHKRRYKKSELGRVIWYAGGHMDWENVLASHTGVDEVDRGQFLSPAETDFASGCCMVIKKDVFDEVGLFDKQYFLYYEDNDLSQRAKRKGFKIFFQPDSVIWHINAGSVGGSGSDMQDYYITRNRLIFASKFASKRAKFAILRESLNLLLTGRKWQRRGVSDYYLRNFGKGSFK